MENLFIYTGLVFWYSILLMLGLAVIYVIYILLFNIFISKTKEYGVVISYNQLIKYYRENNMDKQYSEFLYELKVLIKKYRDLSEK